MDVRGLRRMNWIAVGAVAALGLEGCRPVAPVAHAPQAMPVMVAPVSLAPVPSTETYVATIKSRRSATIQPQVDGNLTRIAVTSGQVVKAGQVLMQINPLKQTAAVQQQTGTQAQSNALYQFNKTELDRQKRLFDAGITSKQAYDSATQAFQSSKAAYDATAAGTATQRQQLAYYQIRAPFPGIVGDIPVHQGDYVSPTTLLTTVDENAGLEAYIYIPTERAGLVRVGLPVELLDTSGKVLAKTAITFVSPQVDGGIQGILAKAAIPAGGGLRNQQIVNARVTWNTTPKPTVPVLAVTQIGGQAFVYLAKAGGPGGAEGAGGAAGKGFTAHQVPVTVGDTIGNAYPVLTGLVPGDQVIVSGLQFIAEGAPVQPMTGQSGPPGPPAGAKP